MKLGTITRSKAGVLAVTAFTALALVAGACGDDDDDGNGDAPEPTNTTAAAAASPTTEAADASPTTEAAATPAPSGDATIATAEAGTLGTILVDADGLTLYVFGNDVAGSGASACTGGCAEVWPAATVDGEPTAGDGVMGELGTITRDDGTAQVTYNGLPLYRFVNDAAPGDTNGTSVPNWSVATP